MTKKNAPDLSDLSSPGGGSVCVGDDVTDTACSLEAPRKPRSEAQIAAFEKARAKRAANRASSAPPAPAAPAAPPPAPAGGVTPPIPPISPTPAPAVPPAPKRKTRTDKGKKRGYIVKGDTWEDYPREGSSEGGLGGGSPPPAPRSGYDHFVIV